MYRIQPMISEFAGEISRWKYPDEYSVYSFEPSQELTDELLDGSYYSCADEHGQLIGYFCFGLSARIPTAERYPYAGEYLDIGLGLAPEVCGRGLGAGFLRAGLDFAVQTWHPRAFRLTVACFNLRAIRTYEKLDFRTIAPVTHKNSGMRFQIMQRTCEEAIPC